MKSYLHDENIYRQLEAQGRHLWDEQSDPEASFDRFLLRPFLEMTLAQIGTVGAGRRVLEIGCGTGPASCFLAARGFDVVGVDVSPAAIEMAGREAARRGLRVHFTVADICDLPLDSDRYDLVVDGHCLHCLVADADRTKALSVVHHLLRADGLFVVETMVSHEGLRIGERYRYDDDGVLWISVGEPSGYEAAIQRGGAWHIPYRRILPPEAVVAEMTTAGFTVASQGLLDQKGEGKPRLLQLRCVRR